MSDEELCKGLRLLCFIPTTQAADRIEQLVATNEALTKERDRWKDACRSASRDLNIVVPDNDRLKSERDAAEAKLARAVEALRVVDALDPEGMIDGCSQSALRGLVLRMGEIARATLAEIEGEKG